MHVVIFSACLFLVMLSGTQITVVVVAAVIQWLLGRSLVRAGFP